MWTDPIRRFAGSSIALAAVVALVFGGAAAEAEQRNIAGTIAGLPDVGHFAAAFERFEVETMLSGDMTYTVFAPTDLAMEQAGAEFTTVDDVLAYIVEGSYSRGELLDPEGEDVVLTSLAGTEILVRLGQPGDVLLDGRAVIALPDTQVANVTIHTIDAMLGVHTTSG